MKLHEYERAAKFFTVADRFGQQIGHAPYALVKQKIEAAKTTLGQKLPQPEIETAPMNGSEWSLGEIFHRMLS